MTEFLQPNSIKDNLKTFPNLRQNLTKYLILIMKDYSHFNKSGIRSASKGTEHTINATNDASIFINIEDLIPFFIDECQQNFLQIDSCFIGYYLHLLIRDNQDGLKLNLASQSVSIEKVEQFLIKALAKYKNSTDATVNCLKMAYIFKNQQSTSLDFVKEKYEFDFNTKLQQLINSILQYPETSSGQQLEELFIKMQMFIITNYQIGYPDNVLLEQCRQSLNSILSKGDIQKYVLRKRYHRLEYLRKLGATAVGILIFNNQGAASEKQSIRNIFADLKMAKTNTKDFLQEGFDRVFDLKQKAVEVILRLFEINMKEKYIIYLRPQTQIQELNKFVTLFEIYKNCLEKIGDIFEKTQYLIEMDQKKFECVVEKINEILKYRSAIESEVIFPHFVYLSELWNSLVLYLNHLAEINKTKDHLDSILSEELENKFDEILMDLADKNGYLESPVKYSIQEIFNSAMAREIDINTLNIKPFVKEYCAFTFALTGGILLPSNMEKKLSENVNFRFGFSKVEYLKYAEYTFKEFVQVFSNILLTKSHLIVLFELDKEVIQQDFNLVQKMQATTKSLDTQTEMILNDNPSKNQINTTWNIWDFYRETIKLANIRKTQTHSTQSNSSFGRRNAQTQCNRKIKNSTQI